MAVPYSTCTLLKPLFFCDCSSSKQCTLLGIIRKSSGDAAGIAKKCEAIAMEAECG